MLATNERQIAWVRIATWLILPVVISQFPGGSIFILIISSSAELYHEELGLVLCKKHDASAAHKFEMCPYARHSLQDIHFSSLDLSKSLSVAHKFQTCPFARHPSFHFQAKSPCFISFASPTIILQDIFQCKETKGLMGFCHCMTWGRSYSIQCWV